jgi:putative ABC transport system permease protein
MKAWDALRLASTALVNRRLRAALCTMGIAIGIIAALILTALGEGARDYVTQEFEFLGSDLVIVLPGKNETTGVYPGVAGVPNDLTLADAEMIQRTFRSARSVAPVAIGLESVSHRERSRDAVLLGTTDEMLDARDLRVASGRFLPDMDWQRGASVAVLGTTLARELFPGQSPIGSVVRVGDFRFRVVGILEEQGVHMGMDMDEVVLVPVATALRMFNRESLFRILIRVQSGADGERLKERVRALLIDRHEEEDFTLLTPDAMADTLGAIIGRLSMALVGIAAVSLSVAGLGVMNVMLVSVSERTREVGLLKALGARRRQILSLFLLESALLSALGGALGLGVSYAVVELADQLLPAFPLGIPGWAVPLALGVCSAVGLVFGVLPALRATRLDPVNSLAGKTS